MNPVDSHEWRDILGYEGHYRVSRAGEVYSLKSNRILKQANGWDGYRRVTLFKNAKKAANFLVHRLVAAAFLGPIPANFQVNHKDGEKENCDVSNLEIVTPAENQRHAEATGLRKPIDGERNINARLTERDVRDIHRLNREGWTDKAIAREFSVSVRQIQKILAGKAWRQVYENEAREHLIQGERLQLSSAE